MCKKTMFRNGIIVNLPRERFSEKSIVAFANSTVFILDFYIMTEHVWSHAWILKKAHIVSCHES